MRRVVAFFFLFLFVFSSIPIKELGKSMAKGSNTEQVEDDFDCDEDDDIFKVKHATPEYFEEHNVAHASSTPIYNQRVVKVLDQVSLYLTIYVSQIPSPPPDFA